MKAKRVDANEFSMIPAYKFSAAILALIIVAACYRAFGA